MEPVTPSTPRRKRLSRDQRRDILLMRKLGYSYEYIADFLKVSQRAVQYTCQKQQSTPQHDNAGRPPRLSKEEADRVEEFVTQSKRARRMTYLQVAEELWPEGEISADSVRYTLRLRGYSRRIAARKPPLSEANRIARLEWAKEHIYWTEEQWQQIVWSDETWVTAGKHRRVLVTRKVDEELLPDCVIERVQRKRGWMFWGCFHYNKKGPSLFWEKEWGTINKESYTQRIVPLVDGWLRLYPGLLFMQDNAPAHSAALTREELRERGIPVIFWPAFSPDLNPVETLWNEMKDWLAREHPSEQQVSCDILRERVHAAWNAITTELLSHLVGTMQQRCQDVIDAEGRHTKW